MRITLKRHALLYSAAGALFLAGTLQAGLVSTVNAGGQFFNPYQTFGCSNAGTTIASCSVSAGVDAFHVASGSYQANARYGSLDVTSMSSIYGGFLDGTSAAGFSDTVPAYRRHRVWNPRVRYGILGIRILRIWWLLP